MINFRDHYFNERNNLFDHFFNRQSKRREERRRFDKNGYPIYGDRQGDWTQTKSANPQLKELKIKSGTPLYEWNDVKFMSVDKDAESYGPRLWVMVPKLEISEAYNLKDILREGKLPNYVTGASEKERAEQICKLIWQYLINTGKFPYPIEILN